MIPRKSSCKGTKILLVWCWKDLGSNPNSAIYCSVKVTQSCSTLCVPTDYTVHGILQTRILEWVAFPFSRGYSPPRDWTQVSSIARDSLSAETQGKLENTGMDSLSLLQWIFLTQELNWGLLHCRWILYQPSYQESLGNLPSKPHFCEYFINITLLISPKCF